MNKSRRLFLAGLITSVSSFGLIKLSHLQDTDSLIQLPDNVGETFNLSGISTLGRAYLSQYPSEANLEFLHRKLFAQHFVQSDIPENEIQYMLEQHQSDCEKVNMVTVANCLLSRTEARFYAYLSLHVKEISPS